MPNNPNRLAPHFRQAFHAGVTDEELLTRFVDRRDEDAFAALVHRHASMVWGVCRRILQNHHDAEDAFQACFLVLCRRAKTVRPESLSSWLYGVAYRTAMKAKAISVRRRAKEKQVRTPELATRDQSSSRDLQSMLDQELSRLPERHRIVLVLCDLEGRTRSEVARQLGLPEGTVGSRLARARAALAKRLSLHDLAWSAAFASETVSNGVPTSVVSSAIKAASGLISAKVAALVEGVLFSMFLNKVRATTAVLVLIGLVATGAGLVYRAVAAEKEHAQAAAAPNDVQDLRKAKEEIERLRAENETLKRRVQGDEVKYVVKVYPVLDLVGPPSPEQKEAESLIRIVSNTIKPMSWVNAGEGGHGSLDYFPEGVSLVVNHSPEVQEKVKELLEALRKAKKEQHLNRKEDGAAQP